MPVAELHDGSTLDVDVRGSGPTLLLPVNPWPVEGPAAEEMRAWGADPALGHSLAEGLRDVVRVAAFDYEGHVLSNPKPQTLTPENIAADFLAVADAVGADEFAYYGYSWLAVSGLQFALRTDRLWALVMGGYPPVDGPYPQMLQVTTMAHEMASSAAERRAEGSAALPSAEAEPDPAEADSAAPAESGAVAADELDWGTVEISLPPEQTQQFVTLYERLRTFDDRAEQQRLRCPRMCFVGSADEIVYDERWGGVRVDLAGPVVRRRAELEQLGWDVQVLDGLDHIAAMQARAVLGVLRPWLEAHLPTCE